MLRGVGGHVLEEAERSIHDALCVLSQAAAVCRGTWARVTIGHFRHLALQNV